MQPVHGLHHITAIAGPAQEDLDLYRVLLGMPLVNEVVLPLAFKDIFNASEPSGDAPLFTSNEAFRNRILDPEVAKLYTLLYGISVPPAPRNDLVQVFLTGLPGANMPPNVTPAEMIRLNVAVPVTAQPNRLGAIAGDIGGFPNGRRLGDDVVDISLRVVAGVLVDGFNKSPNNALTDGVDANDEAFLSTFPYVALPHQGFESRPHSN
jgi:catechol 2,3-dioxygenase-like lactoylglutathione lyase family enzyme